MQAVLFEIQLLKAKDTEPDPPLDHGETMGNTLKPGGPNGYEEIESQGGPEFSRGEDSSVVVAKDRRGSHGLRSILLKGEMRYLKDVNMLVFLCSPL